MTFKKIYTKSRNKKFILNATQLTPEELITLFNESELILFLKGTLGGKLAVETTDTYIGFRKTFDGKPRYIILKIEQNNESMDLWLKTSEKMNKNIKLDIWENLTVQKSTGAIYSRDESTKGTRYLSDILEKIVELHNTANLDTTWKEEIEEYTQKPSAIKAMLLELRFPNLIYYYENFYLPMEKIIKNLKEKKPISI
ncbi:hypothetical protein KO317_03760 [Candidatus Micrarchaeota archaeon]|jgi:hypothetical protein|nr:hypothetical protein [Candidatus Micrarchaeota archaeon]